MNLLTKHQLIIWAWSVGEAAHHDAGVGATPLRDGQCRRLPSELARGCGGPEKNGKEGPIWKVAQFGEMSRPGS